MSTAALPRPVAADGTLPVNADAIESALLKLWDQTIATKQPDVTPVKLTLATILIVANADSRAQAEALAGELAGIEPSRIISIYVADDGDDYFASVRTACSRRQDDGSIICWELIDISAAAARVPLLPGAIRSLIPSSVPVITVDLREYQGSPALDEVLRHESNYMLTRARSVPSVTRTIPWLSFDWYRTHALRELISQVYSEWSLGTAGLRLVELTDKPSLAEAAQLLIGWLVARAEQSGGAVTSHGSSATVRLHERPVEIGRYHTDEKRHPILRLTAERLQIACWLDDTEVLSHAHFRGPRATAQVTLDGVQHSRTFRGLDLGHYLVRATKNGAEFTDFLSAQTALRTFQLQA